MTVEITEYAKRVQPDVLGCPRQLVLRAVVDALIDYCGRTHCMELVFEHEVVTADVQTADNDSVNVNIASYITDVRPRVVSEFRIDGQVWNLARIALENVMDDISEIAVEGTKYFTYPDTTHIKFYDLDAQDQTLWIKQVYVPEDTITTVDEQFFYEHHRAIEAGARARLMDMPGKDWTNLDRARKFEAEFNDGIALAIIRKNPVVGSRRPRSMRFC